ncbi:MAG: SRPBCC family protein [Solirubrobacteraceae bacterium MAG38_C4-C5]|nr:SRPBCC family protein [Candidatus Siliceabacter maunaloa]
MRTVEAIDVSAPAQAVWRVIADPQSYLHVMAGITRWEVSGEQRRGVGARYKMLMRVRSADIGGLIEIVEWDEPTELAWTSVTGLDQRGRWRLRERVTPSHPPRTHVELRLSYGVAGSGLPGWLAEHLAAPTVAGHLRTSLRQLKRRVEHEQLRTAASARREARAAT